MKLQIWINGFFFISLLLQVISSAEEGPKSNLTALQEKVEKLIETVMIAIQEYYQQSEKEYKCLPDKYTDELMNAVKNGIDCVEKNHKKFQEGDIDLQEHRKEFLKCFEKAKNTVENVLQNSDPAENKCPPEMVEKTFQINVTTSYTKTFNLNIQNGVDVLYNKTIAVTRNENPCQNYPDVFSFVEDSNKRHETEITSNRTSGILYSSSGNGNGYHGSRNQEKVRHELTTARNSLATHDVKTSTPLTEHLSQQPKDEFAYAYFQEFQSAEDAEDEQELGQPRIFRKLRNAAFENRQSEVAV